MVRANELLGQGFKNAIKLTEELGQELAEHISLSEELAILKEQEKVGKIIVLKLLLLANFLLENRRLLMLY